MTRGRRSERQWWKFRDTGVKIQDIHDDRVEIPGHRVEIQDIHDDSGGSSGKSGAIVRNIGRKFRKIKPNYSSRQLKRE